MVEINNQRKAFLDMLAWSEGTDNGRQKARNHGYDVIYGQAYLLIARSPSQTCHAKPKTQINERQTLPASFFPLLMGCLHWLNLASKGFSRKSRDAVAVQQIQGACTLPMIDHCWYPSGNRPFAAISGLHCRALVMVSSSIRLTAWLQNSKKRAERSERLMYEQSHRDYLSALVICIIVCLSWAVNHYRDKHTLPTKPSATKMPENWKAGERGNYWHADASAWCCCNDAKYTKELADAKAENDALRDDVAAGRRRLHIQSVSQCDDHRTSGVDNATPRLADTAERDYFTTQKADHPAKNNWKEPRSILMSSADRVAHIDGQLG